MLPELLTHQVYAHGIATDEQGLSAQALRETLKNWRASDATRNRKFPKAIYTVPTGGNPAGTTASTERKREILGIAREYGILILEDDPYYFLTFDEANHSATPPQRIVSYFELEREGAERYGYGYVLRFESFSKILSAGMRLGYMMGPPVLINAVVAITASTNLHASGPPQAMASALLQHWGVEGFLRHTNNVARMYKERRDIFGTKLEEILGRGKDGKQAPLATWVTPVAGMFYWIKLHLPASPQSPEGDSYQIIAEKALSFGVLAMPGSAFFADCRATPYVRTSFSLIDASEAQEAILRLRRAVESAWQDAGYATIPPMQPC